MPSFPAPPYLPLAYAIGGCTACLCADRWPPWPTLVVGLAVWRPRELPYVDVGMASVSLEVLLVAALQERRSVPLGFAVLRGLLAVGIAAELTGMHWGGPLTATASLALALLHFGLLPARQRARSA